MVDTKERIHKVLALIDDVKLLMSDMEYKNIVDELMIIHKETHSTIDIMNDIINIRRDMRRMVAIPQEVTRQWPPPVQEEQPEQERPQRLCSICKQPGHNRRTCTHIVLPNVRL